MVFWRDAGVAELARLESVCTSKGYRGFESLSLRFLKFGNIIDVLKILYFLSMKQLEASFKITDRQIIYK